MFDIRVVPDQGEPYEVKVQSRDIVVWEKTGQNRAMADLKNRLRMSDVMVLAHIASRRLGLFNGSLDQFTDTCDVEWLQGQAQQVDPTQSAPSADD